MGGGIVVVQHGHGAGAQVPIGHQAVVLLEPLHRLGGEPAVDAVGTDGQIPQLQQSLLPDQDLIGLVPDPQGVGHGAVPEEGLQHNGIHGYPVSQLVPLPEPLHGIGGLTAEVAVRRYGQVAQLDEPLLDVLHLHAPIPGQHGVEGGILVVQFQKGLLIAKARFRQAVAPLEQGHGGGHAGLVHVLGLLELQILQRHEPDLDVQHDGGAHADANHVPIQGVQGGCGRGHLRGHGRGHGGGWRCGGRRRDHGLGDPAPGHGRGGHLNHVLIAVQIRFLHLHRLEGALQELPGDEPTGHKEARHEYDQDPDQRCAALALFFSVRCPPFHGRLPPFSYILL